MNHLWIAYDAITVGTGLVALALLYFARLRARFLPSFAMFYLLFTANLVVALSRQYAIFNVVALPSQPVFLSYALGLLLDCTSLYFAVRCAHQLLRWQKPAIDRAAALMLGLSVLLSAWGIRYEPQSATYVFTVGAHVAKLLYLGVLAYVVCASGVASVRAAEPHERTFARYLVLLALTGLTESSLGFVMQLRHPVGELGAGGEEFLYSSVAYFLFSLFLARYLSRLIRLPAFEHDPTSVARLGLSARENDVLRLALDGLNNKRIARELNISVATVKTHMNNIFRKAKVRSRFELAARLRAGVGLNESD